LIIVNACYIDSDDTIKICLCGYKIKYVEEEVVLAASPDIWGKFEARSNEEGHGVMQTMDICRGDFNDVCYQSTGISVAETNK
jgi:hypothetical protein